MWLSEKETEQFFLYRKDDIRSPSDVGERHNLPWWSVAICKGDDVHFPLQRSHRPPVKTGLLSGLVVCCCVQRKMNNFSFTDNHRPPVKTIILSGLVVRGCVQRNMNSFPLLATILSESVALTLSLQPILARIGPNHPTMLLFRIFNTFLILLTNTRQSIKKVLNPILARIQFLQELAQCPNHATCSNSQYFLNTFDQNTRQSIKKY